jgi:hypothetical protein
MTEGHSPQTRTGSAVDPDHDTTALPTVAPSVPPIPPVTGQPPASRDRSAATSSYGPGSGYLSGTAFSTPSYSGGSSPTSHSGSATPPDPDATGTIGAVGAKIAAAGAAAVTAATQAASSAKDAIKSAASEAEARARPVRGASRAGRQPRKARLTLSHINVYSVFKFSCVLAIALFFVWLIMVGVLYGLLDVAGVLTKVNDAVRRISGNDNAKDVVTGSLVFGSAIIIGAVNIILFIAISTIGSMVYNLCSDLVGGAEVTLSERE